MFLLPSRGGKGVAVEVDDFEGIEKGEVRTLLILKCSLQNIGNDFKTATGLLELCLNLVLEPAQPNVATILCRCCDRLFFWLVKDRI